MTPRMRGVSMFRDRRSMISFWLMVAGMLLMVLSFAFAGVVQTYLWRILGMDFMTVRTEYVSFWLFWVWFFGIALFLPGVLLYLWDFFRIKNVTPGGSSTD